MKKKAEYLPSEKERKPVINGTGTNRRTRPAVLSRVKLEKAGKSRFAAKFF